MPETIKMIVLNPDGESRRPHFKAVRGRAIKAYVGRGDKGPIHWNREWSDSRSEDLFQEEQSKKKKGHCFRRHGSTYFRVAPRDFNARARDKPSL